MRAGAPTVAGGVRTWLALRVALAVAAIGTVAFHLATAFPRWTDENVHLYVAQRLAQGAVLYRDIHSARPPLALWPLMVGLWAGLPPVLVARGWVVALTLALAALVGWVGRSLYGPLSGACGALALLVMPEVLARSTYTGIHLVALFGCAAVALVLLERPGLAGLSGGLALAAGQHAAVLVAGATVLVLWRVRRQKWLFFKGLGTALAVTFGVAAVRAGPTAVWTDLAARHLYHLDGATPPQAAGDLGFFLWSTVAEQAPWLVLACGAAAWPRGPGRRPLALIAAAHVGIVAGMSGGLALYLFPAVPFLALLAGDGLATWLTATSKKVRWSGVLVVAALVAGWTVAKSAYERRDHESYSWFPGLRALQLARLQRLVVADQVVDVLRPMMREGETVFGAPPLASQVALGLQRRFSGELADLAPRWLAMGLVSRREVIERIEADRVRALVEQAGAFDRDPTFKAYLQHCYGQPLVLDRVSGEGRGIPRVNVYLHLDTPCLATEQSH